MPKPWFNEDCKQVIAAKNKALGSFKLNPNNHNLKLFRINRAKARKTIKHSKKTLGRLSLPP